MAGRADTGGLVHAEADVAILADPRLPGVQAHPHLDLDRFGPRVGGEVALRVGSRRDRVLPPLEATKNESPCVSTSRPWCAANAARRMRWCSASTSP